MSLGSEPIVQSHPNKSSDERDILYSRECLPNEMNATTFCSPTKSENKTKMIKSNTKLLRKQKLLWPQGHTIYEKTKTSNRRSSTSNAQSLIKATDSRDRSAIIVLRCGCLKSLKIYNLSDRLSRLHGNVRKIWDTLHRLLAAEVEGWSLERKTSLAARAHDQAQLAFGSSI